MKARTDINTNHSYNKYNTFGCRSKFLEIYIQLREKIADPDVNTKMNHKKQVSAANAWFKEALLMDENSTTSKPTKLLDVFSLPGGLNNTENWQLIWIGLANYSAIIKLFICKMQLGEIYPPNELKTFMPANMSDKSKGSTLGALTNTLRDSPLGFQVANIIELDKLIDKNTSGAPVGYVLKGEKENSPILQLARLSVAPDKLVILYSLFLIAEKAQRQSFTVRELQSTDMDTPYTSPIPAFGLDVEEFVKICRGLEAMYPEYIICNFTLNLDEIIVRTDKKSITDVIELIIQARGASHAL